MDEENKIRQLQQQLEDTRENLRQEREKFDKHSREIEDQFGIDYLNLLQGNPVQQPVRLVQEVHRVFNEDGELLTSLVEEHVEKRDGVRVLLRFLLTEENL